MKVWENIGIREEARTFFTPWPCCFPAFLLLFWCRLVGCMTNPLTFSWKILAQTFNTSGAETFCRYLLHGLHFGICEAGSWQKLLEEVPLNAPKLCLLRLVRDPVERPTVADALNHSFVEEQESSQGEDDEEAGFGWFFGGVQASDI